MLKLLRHLRPAVVYFWGNESIYLHRSGPLLDSLALTGQRIAMVDMVLLELSLHVCIYRRGRWRQRFALKICFSCSLGGGGGGGGGGRYTCSVSCIWPRRSWLPQAFFSGPPIWGRQKGGLPDLFRFVPISPSSSDLFRFVFLVLGIPRFVPICSDLLRFLPMCSHLHSLFAGIPRFVPICSDFFRFACRTSQNRSGKPPKFLPTPFASPPIYSLTAVIVF